MALTIALFIGARHTNIHWKSEKDVYVFGILEFFFLNLGKKKLKYSVFSNLSSAEFYQHSLTLIKHIS
jgi:hypothetical protein